MGTMGMCQGTNRAPLGQEKPHLQYFPIAARGEVIRMTAKLGGVEITEAFAATDDEKLACGSPGSLPIMTHGDGKLSQSLAVETYIAMLSPKYGALTAHQRAKDVQFSGIKDDLLEAEAKFIFGEKDAEKDAETCAKWWNVLESMAPTEGFV